MSSSLKTVLITFGPGSVAIDSVRRITNQSTGKLGIFLCNFFLSHGWRVVPLPSKWVSSCDPLLPPLSLTQAEFGSFETTEELKHALQLASTRYDVSAVLHLAALSDFDVHAVYDENGKPLVSFASSGAPEDSSFKRSKISSAHPRLTIELQPAPKLIADLRELFPRALLVGWKYVVGDKEHGLESAFQQIARNQTDACVLNSNDSSQGFDFCTLPKNNADSTRNHAPCRDREELARMLLKWISSLH